MIQNDDRLRIGTVPLGGSLIRTDALEGAVLGGGRTHARSCTPPALRISIERVQMGARCDVLLSDSVVDTPQKRGGGQTIMR